MIKLEYKQEILNYLKKAGILVLCFLFIFLSGCSNEETSYLVEQNSSSYDIKYDTEDGNMSEVAYFAGGCFWGMEKYMNSVPGVLDVVVGYANGNDKEYDNPYYDLVCSGLTGYKEAVKVTYDPSKLSYDMLVKAFFMAINPSIKNRQGNDIGEQYQSGIYYIDEKQKDIALEEAKIVMSEVDVFAVEIEPLSNFYDAEGYHQDYLEKNPSGYCHISDKDIKEMQELFE